MFRSRRERFTVASDYPLRARPRFCISRSASVSGPNESDASSSRLTGAFDYRTVDGNREIRAPFETDQVRRRSSTDEPK